MSPNFKTKTRLSTDYVVRQSGVNLSTSTETTERVVHARAHEADKRDHQQLDLGRRIPGQMQAEEVESLVFPSSWEVDSADGFGVLNAVGLGRSGIDGRVALGLDGFLLRH